MNKKFLQSIIVGIAALTLATSCSSHSKIESNTCGAMSGCASKKDEANKPATQETKSVKAVKAVKKAKKAKVAKSTKTSTETKTEEKSN
jgi:hypothetical protein